MTCGNIVLLSYILGAVPDGWEGGVVAPPDGETGVIGHGDTCEGTPHGAAAPHNGGAGDPAPTGTYGNPVSTPIPFSMGVWHGRDVRFCSG